MKRSEKILIEESNKNFTKELGESLKTTERECLRIMVSDRRDIITATEGNNEDKREILIAAKISESAKQEIKAEINKLEEKIFRLAVDHVIDSSNNILSDSKNLRPITIITEKTKEGHEIVLHYKRIPSQNWNKNPLYISSESEKEKHPSKERLGGKVDREEYSELSKELNEQIKELKSAIDSNVAEMINAVEVDSANYLIKAANRTMDIRNDKKSNDVRNLIVKKCCNIIDCIANTVTVITKDTAVAGVGETLKAAITDHIGTLEKPLERLSRNDAGKEGSVIREKFKFAIQNLEQTVERHREV